MSAPQGPPPPPPPPMGPSWPQAAQPGWSQPAAPAPAKTGMNGCAKAALIGLAVVAGLGLLGVIGLIALAGLFADKVDKAVEAAGDCDVVTVEQAGSVLGGSPDLFANKGLGSLVNLVADTRVLADAPSCYATNGDGASARVAVLDAADGRVRFAAERAKAEGVKQDRGNGLSVESERYLDRAVEGLGDEAFCTTPSLSGASGVLARRGDRLVYVSIQPDADGASPELLDSRCDLAEKLVRQLL